MLARNRAPRLLLVTDARRARWPLLDFTAAAVAGGVDAIYLRDIARPAQDLAVLVSELRERIGPEPDVQVNGDPRIARAIGMGLHLRERDVTPGEARALLGGDTLIGKSVHSAEDASLATGADYLLAGHVFPSASKPGRPPLGVAGFAAIVAAAPCPVLAIGGITPERVQEVVQAGAHGVAVIGAIAEADDPRAAASALCAALDDAFRSTEQESMMNDGSSPTGAGATVEIVVNGKTTTVPAAATVHDFLASKGMTDAMAIVERNGTIVPRIAYGATALEAGDRLEVVHAVGGGSGRSS